MGLALRENRPSVLDYIIIFTFLTIAVFSLVYVNIFLYKGSARGVVIENDGKIYAKYDFNSILDKKLVEINTIYGYNIIELENGRARMLFSECPDQICVNTGWIDKPNQIIVCLPSRTVVRLEGKSDVDYVSY